MKNQLNALAAHEAAGHRRRLLELFAPTQSLMIGAFTVGLDDILAELSAKYCYLVAAEVSAQARSPTFQSVTSAATATTSPATSRPGRSDAPGGGG